MVACICATCTTVLLYFFAAQHRVPSPHPPSSRFGGCLHSGIDHPAPRKLSCNAIPLRPHHLTICVSCTCAHTRNPQSFTPSIPNPPHTPLPPYPSPPLPICSVHATIEAQSLSPLSDSAASAPPATAVGAHARAKRPRRDRGGSRLAWRSLWGAVTLPVRLLVRLIFHMLSHVISVVLQTLRSPSFSDSKR